MHPMKAVPAARSALLLALVLAACATPSPSAAPPGASGPPRRRRPRSPRAGADSDRIRTAPSGEPIAEDPPPLALEEVATGLDAPINITVTPDGWLLVNERIGRVIAVDPESGSTEVALDISDRVLESFEQGLLGLALHPDWPDDPRAYVHYSSREGDGDTVLSEFRVTDDAAAATARSDDRARAADGRSAVRQPQRRAARVRAGWAPLHGPRRRRLRGRPPRQRPEPATCCSARSCASTSTTAMAPTPSRPRIPSPMAGARRRSSSSAFATPGASASTARPACSGSGTPARTRPRRSTASIRWPMPAPTSAGT